MSEHEQTPLSLADFAERCLRPAMLLLFGLPDTEEGRAVLDALVEEAFADV